ncbi:hypothetical protein [Nocardioides yefusunii]|uniref:Uncharacterized protein n=1 Tax=Nocardioides yefusunii TaxID=2500546 RepID=A0ABW1QS35_9ACTN|nr:hypothetical protein [Nocardioides yefusunii]
MNDSTSPATSPTGADAIDDLVWDDWTPAQVCAIENGPDCEACEG